MTSRSVCDTSRSPQLSPLTHAWLEFVIISPCFPCRKSEGKTKSKAKHTGKSRKSSASSLRNWKERCVVLAFAVFFCLFSMIVLVVQKLREVDPEAARLLDEKDAMEAAKERVSLKKRTNSKVCFPSWCAVRLCLWLTHVALQWIRHALRQGGTRNEVFKVNTMDTQVIPHLQK